MSSATEITGEPDKSQVTAESAASLAGARANPVALEVPVNATGTRPGSSPDKRELFTEETETVLVFADGAVIRLSAAVTTGQLIFITNKKTNIEVVCQVVSKRVYRPTSCYVELQFTEQIADFWGVEFPKSEPGREIPAPIESVETAEITEDGAELHAPPPSGEEVEQLRSEVELLRKQLGGLKKTEEAGKAVTKMTLPTAAMDPLPVETAPAEVASSPIVAEGKLELMDASEPAPLVSSVPLVPFIPAVPAIPPSPPSEPPGLSKTFGLASDVAEAKRNEELTKPGRTPQTKMALPKLESVKIDAEQEAIDQLLPQPELDFSKAPKRARLGDPNDPYSIYKPTRAKMGKWTLTALVLVLVGAVGFGVWKLGLVQNLLSRRGKDAEAVVAEGAANKVAPVPSPTAGEGAPEKENAAEADAPAPEVAPAAATPVPTPKPPKAPSTPNGKELRKAKASDFHAAGPAPSPQLSHDELEALAIQAEREKRLKAAGKAVTSAGGTGRSANKKKDGDSEQKDGSAIAPAVDDSVVVPAKLLKAANPVYPPDAMRGFITGDVRLQAEIDEHGKIGKMEVVSGPAALRPAAIEAMKQYVYAPATKGGNGVQSTVRVTIKFWFDP